MLDLSNSANWQPIHSKTYNAVVTNPTPNRIVYTPIPLITIPVLLERQYVAIYSYSNSAKPTWFTSGYLYRKIGTGIQVGAEADAFVGSGSRLFLGRLQVFSFPLITSTYELSISVNKWLTDFTVNVYEYVGTE